MNNAFRLANTVYGMDTCIFKLNVFTKQADCESNPVLCSSFHVVNILLSLSLCALSRSAGELVSSSLADGEKGEAEGRGEVKRPSR